MVVLPREILAVVDQARALDAEAERGVTASMVSRARACLNALDFYCTGPEAAERSRAVIDALNAPVQAEVAW